MDVVRAHCPDAEALVGITGRSDQTVAAVTGAICVALMADGKWASAGAARRSTGPATAAGRDFTLQCPPDHGVTGISGRAGSVVDGLSLRCAPLGQDAQGLIAVTSAGLDLVAVGGTGGSPFAENCPGGTVASVVESASSLQQKSTQKIRLGCERYRSIRMYGVESLVLSKDSLRPGESATLKITLKGPAGPDHRMIIHSPSYVVPADFTAEPGWTVVVPPRMRTATITIQANPKASPAFGGPYVDLHAEYDNSGPTKRLTVVPAQ